MSKYQSKYTRDYFNKKNGRTFSAFKFLLISSVIVVATSYASNEYIKFTRNITLSEYALGKLNELISNQYNDMKSNIVDSAREKHPTIYKELDLFITKFDKNYSLDNIKSNKKEEFAKKSGGEGVVTKTDDNISISERQKKFTMKHLIAAQNVEREFLIPAIFMVGQAGHETGWGRSEIKYSNGEPAYNLFGIKATGGWSGKTVDIITTEHLKGKDVKLTARFRAYNSYEESFKDYAKLISNSPRYAAAKEAAEKFAIEIQKAGYATDPKYAEKLSKSILITTKVNP